MISQSIQSSSSILIPRSLQRCQLRINTLEGFSNHTLYPRFSRDAVSVSACSVLKTDTEQIGVHCHLKEQNCWIVFSSMNADLEDASLLLGRVNAATRRQDR